VIGDHLRSVVHMIADGITASNLGRGYVLRRLIRRVVRHGRLIGIERDFTGEVAETAIALSEAAYPNVRDRQTVIQTELKAEESRFRETLDRGEKLLNEIVSKLTHEGKPGEISGDDAFTLYDTFGFPLELTQEVAEENGLTVDAAGFEKRMEEQRGRSRDAQDTIDLTVQSTLDQLAEHLHETKFLGYAQASSEAEVKALLVAGKAVELADLGTDVQLILDQTPFYAESGGQVGDRGSLYSSTVRVQIIDVQKEGSLFVHFGTVEQGTLKMGDRLTAQVDLASRRRAQANHTATHLLQAALKQIVDPNIAQAGSLVAFDRLRFDFNLSRAVTPDELHQIEDQINAWITEAHVADVAVMPIAQAKAKGAVAMFGEKYGDEVRVIDFPGVSMELCGGVHVNNTAEIGLFKVISESGVAAGIRRIEAVAGAAVLEYLNVREKVVRELGDRFKVKPEDLGDRVMALQTELKTTQKQLESLKSELALAKADQLLSQAEPIGSFKIIVASLEGVDPESLKTAAETLLQKLGEGAVVLGSVPEPEKVSLVAAFSPGVNQKGLQAGKLIGAIAKICGGGGGGRPQLAQAGGKDADKLPEALKAARQALEAGLG
jgi:alanyl-tRNA synthetase